KLYKECQHEENKMKEDKSNSTFEIDTDEQSSYEENLQITEEDKQNTPREEDNDTQEHQEEEERTPHNARRHFKLSGPNAKQEGAHLWEILKDELNCEVGPEKSVHQWQS
ncbi:hypothetical protein CBL_20427, partial [Carabus blaptoides fortunei]